MTYQRFREPVYLGSGGSQQTIVFSSDCKNKCTCAGDGVQNATLLQLHEITSLVVELQNCRKWKQCFSETCKLWIQEINVRIRLQTSLQKKQEPCDQGVWLLWICLWLFCTFIWPEWTLMHVNVIRWASGRIIFTALRWQQKCVLTLYAS